MFRRVDSRRLAFVVLTAVLFGGCYSYQVVPVEQAPVGQTVRARISPSEADRLREVVGRDDRVLEGELLAPPDSSILVAVRTSVVDASVQTHQRVTVPRQGLVELEVRRLDRWKTVGVTAVVVGVASALAITQFNAEKPTENGGKSGSNKSVVMPPGVSFHWSH
ncbi:MAG TPA: hypothetical protein VL308_10175 [Gemmatimonadaceae bacterium]|nr:hypothetical protein [Gemmatimonadaceae bacterium]